MVFTGVTSDGSVAALATICRPERKNPQNLRPWHSPQPRHDAASSNNTNLRKSQRSAARRARRRRRRRVTLEVVVFFGYRDVQDARVEYILLTYTSRALFGRAVGSSNNSSQINEALWQLPEAASFDANARQVSVAAQMSFFREDSLSKGPTFCLKRAMPAANETVASAGAGEAAAEIEISSRVCSSSSVALPDKAWTLGTAATRAAVRSRLELAVRRSTAGGVF